VTTVTKSQILNWLNTIAMVLQENRIRLSELDAAIGDGDHGINMDRGFRRVKEQLPGIGGQDIGEILSSVGMALISGVGGAAGPLYGTLFIRASVAARNKEELSTLDLAHVLEAGVEGVMERGMSQPGDKTMVDALLPAVEAYRKAVLDNKDLLESLRKAVEAAEAGMESTTPLVARRGRASYLGERSKGHLDPGAVSSYLILKSLLETMERIPS
jgi:dihydroxyacetone kinase-like protein